MKSHRVILLLAVLAVAVISPSAYALTPIESWQMARLFHPSEGDLSREEKGKVIIYDGLTDKTVEKAFDEQFERIDHMMFTRVVVTDDAGEPMRDPETGEVIVEEDGCD